MSKRGALYAVAFAATFVVGAAIGGAAVSFRTISPMAVMVARANLVMVGKDAYSCTVTRPIRSSTKRAAQVLRPITEFRVDSPG